PAPPRALPSFPTRRSSDLSLRLGTPGRFFEGGHQLDFTETLGRHVVLEIEDVGDDQDKAFLIGAVLVRLTEHLRLRQRRQPAGRSEEHTSELQSRSDLVCR